MLGRQKKGLGLKKDQICVPTLAFICTSSEIIRDRKTGDSLGYGFIEYEKEEDAEEAYLKVRS